MSFGFGIGDFITVSELAKKIRKDFVDAPSQFKAISDEVRSLSIVLLDIDVILSDRKLGDEQEADLKQIAHGCRDVLKDLESTLDQYGEHKSGHRGISKKVKRAWKRLKWEPEDIKQLRSRISTNIGLLNAFMSRFTRDNVLTLVQNQEDQGRQNILDWITPIDYALQQDDFINRRQAGTGQWLLDSSEFKTWVETDNQTLFCPGVPGAGKTILASVVVEELNTRFENNGNIGIAYLYCNYRRQHEQKLVDLFVSLLKQFVQEQPSIPDSVKTLYDRYKNKRTRPSLDEISGVLQSVVAKYSRVFIIVDALDECQASDGCRQRFLASLFNLQAKCKINLFATSRPILSIEKEFEGNSKLEIRASEEDVRRYLDSHMFRFPGFVVRSLELQEEIKTYIVKAVDGMFLLAQLHLESLTGKKAPKAVRAALKNLATGSEAYDRAYKDAMERINGQIKDQAYLAKRVLSWITCAKRTLTTLELQHALGVEVGDSKLDKENFSQIEDIVSVCAGLVTIDEESGIVRLVHYTTQEYFERTQVRWFPNIETEITITCITYLSFDVFEHGFCQTDTEFEERLLSNQFFEYAAKNWGHHACKVLTLSQALSRACIDFLKSEAKVEASIQGLLVEKYYSSHLNYSQKVPRKMTGLHLAALFGVKAVVQLLLDTGKINADSKDSYDQTPLSKAAEEGHEAVVQLLLEYKADIESKDIHHQTPLWKAAKRGHKAVVKLLLEYKAEIESKGIYGQTPLLEAAWEGHEAVVKLLLEYKARIESKGNNDDTPLLIAAWRGHVAVVQLLLEHKAEIESKNNYGSTPLSEAVNKGHEAIVKLLLEYKADIESKNNYGSTPLSIAAARGYKTVVQLLLEYKAEIESQDINGETPLSKAASKGYKAVVYLLLEHKADIGSKDVYDKTPLSKAVEKGHKAVVQLLRQYIN